MRRRILFVGGETGGHLYPALALAEELAGRGEVDPVFLTSGGPLATRILEPHGVRTVIGEAPSTVRPLAIGTSGRRLVRILDRERIDAVVALGGRPGVIPGLWARWRRRPLFLLEQNRVLGRANRALLPLATRIFLSFDDTSPEERLRDRALRLGCPVRPSFVPSPPPATDSPVLLVLGGSQGALDINGPAPTVPGGSSTSAVPTRRKGSPPSTGLRVCLRRFGRSCKIQPARCVRLIWSSPARGARRSRN